MSNKPILIGSRQLRERFNDVSQMTLYRWLRDTEMNFPQPIYIKTRRYWREPEVVAFEQSLGDKAHAA